MKFYPCKKGGGGGGKSVSHAEGGHKTFWGGFCAVLEVAVLEGGGREKFPLFKRGGRKKFYPVLRGAQTVSDLRFSHFVAPPPRK